MKKRIKDLTHDTVPATVGLVKSVRDELKAAIVGVDHRVDTVEHRLGSLDKKIDSFRSELKADLQKVLVSVHQTQVLMEEQRGENKIVLDGIKTLFERQERLNHDVKELRR